MVVVVFLPPAHSVSQALQPLTVVHSHAAGYALAQLINRLLVALASLAAKGSNLWV